MKFLHLSDLHLGKVVCEISMIPEQRHLLSQVLDLAADAHLDAVLIAGDIYDRAIPPEEAVELLDDFLSRLSAMKVPVFAISGNHDSDLRLDFGSRLFEKNGVYIAGKYGGTIRQVTLQDSFGPVHIWLLPYLQRALVAHFFPEEDCSTYEKAIQTALSHAPIHFSERNVILSHQFVVGGRREDDPVLSGSETSAKSVGTIDRISYRIYDGYDYVALGHIHRPQRVGRDSVRYAGSPLSYSQAEVCQNKSYTLVTLGAKGTEPEIQTIPVRPLHQMRQLKGHFQDILDHVEDPEDYVYITLTDRTPVPDAFSAIQARYPNAMALRYEAEGGHLDPDLELDAEAPLQDRSFDQQIASFYQSILGSAPSEEERKLLRQVAQEAGILL